MLYLDQILQSFQFPVVFIWKIYERDFYIYTRTSYVLKFICPFQLLYE